MHMVTIEDVENDFDLFDKLGQFIDDKPKDHKCIPECHSIGGEPESEEMYR